MLLCINVLVLLLLQLALSSPVPLTTPSRGCPTCKPKLMQTQASEVLNATAPGVGGQCGVYTLSCALGLRCTPPPGEPRPLRALLEGRGVCSNASSISPTVNPNLADPALTEDPNEGPCRRLLTTLIQGLDAHLFDSQDDIYMPNCDKRGFFRKKQARPPNRPTQLQPVAGHLEGSGAASAGAWIRTACKSHQTPVRRGAWPVRRTQKLDPGTRLIGVEDEGLPSELSLSLHQLKQHSIGEELL
ncbi:Insulin-like growth factor-binding protein 6 [Takifugu flavidus]|uniref:Insulin-like growth factor-binding protein 6 n=1 Tax=Takifugu flavidus TaxID=433684 RepID=A0A5C6N4V1_9TELE|nr:Insulin-like growth factor-binding protein 6 [Takifugu flavidus]